MLNRKDFIFGSAATVGLYALGAAGRKGEMSVQMVLDLPTYNRGPSCECPMQQAIFSVRELPKGVPYRLVVAPRNSFGIAGEPIRTAIRG